MERCGVKDRHTAVLGAYQQHDFGTAQNDGFCTSLNQTGNDGSIGCSGRFLDPAWFVARRGIVMGLLAASTVTGSLLFLPVLASLAQTYGWRGPIVAVTVVCLGLVPFVALFLPEPPSV